MNTENTTPFEPSTETSTEIFDSVSSVPSVSSEPDDELTDLRSENDRLRSELRLITARNELTRLLSAENARSPELLFDASRERLTFDQDGKLIAIDALIADLKNRFPEQFIMGESVDAAAKIEDSPSSGPGFQSAIRSRQSALAPPSINGGAGRSNARTPLTKEQLARMRPREIARLDWNEVKQILSS